MHTPTLLRTTLVVLFLGLLCATAAPAVAQADGDINLVVEPTNATADPGEQQSYAFVVENPDDGVLAYSNVSIELDSPGVANVTNFTENHSDNFSNSEIRDGGAVLFLDAFVPNTFEGPASSVTLVEFTVTAEGAPGTSTALAFNQTADPVVLDSNNTAYNITGFSDGSLSIPEPPNFDVTIPSVDSEVTEGQTVTADYTVENTGDRQDTQDITFEVDGVTESTETGVTLDGGETFGGQFTYDTVAGDAPSLDVSVASENDTVTETVIVNEPAHFAVSLTSVDSEVTEGETVSVAYEVTNTGDVQDTQAIDLAVNGTLEDTESGVTLNGSETFSGQFTYDTVGGDTPAVTVAVSSQDDSASADVTVNEPANFDVTITPVDSAVTAGETITAAYEVANTGDVQDTQDIDFAVNGTAESTESGVTLNGSETFSGQFAYATAADDTPTVSVTVSSQDDSASETVTVNEPANFDVTVTSVDASVTAGETVTVGYEVTNTGDVQDTQDIDFAINGTAEGTDAGVTLNGSETFSSQFTYTTAAGDTPAVSVTLSSNDDSAAEIVAVNEPAVFEVTLTSVTSSVTAGETVTVAYEVTNTGDVQDTQDIDFAVNGTAEDTDAGVTLNGSQTFSRQFSYQTVTGDTPAVSVTVSSQDDSASETVTVNEPANFDVTLTSVDASVTAGETVAVGYEVTNTGDVQDTQDIDFAVNGTTENTEAGVTLNRSETFSSQFTYTTAAGDTPAVSVTLSTNDDSAAEIVAVNEPAVFEVTLTSVTSSVTAGETVIVAYEVTNTGDTQDTQDIEFAVNGTTEGTDVGVTLNGGETFSGQFTYTTAADDTPTVSVAVSSQDDSASATVTVNEPANFDVTITSVDSAVTAGEIITAAYEVTNTGDVQDTQDIEFAVNGTTEDTESGVTLNGSETFSGQFSYTTGLADTPAVSVAVATEDDAATETVIVNEPANFDVTLTNVDTAVTAGETVTVAYDVTNTGGAQDTQDIDFAVNGTTEGTESGVTLNGSETFSGQFSYQTATGDTPAVSVTVSSQDDSVTETVSVNEPSGFDVTLTGVDSSVTAGETIIVAYEVTNTGDVQDTQDIEFAVNGSLEATEAGVTLNGSETVSGQFSYTTAAGDTPALNVAVSSQDDSASVTVTVNEPANFDVTITSVDSAVTEGETITVAYEATNTGDVQDTQDIEFAVNGSLKATEAGVTLNGSETFSGQFAYATAADDTPTVSVTVSSQDDSASETVTVNEPANFDVTVTSVDASVTAGETVTVGYEVTNTGDVQDTQNIEFAVNGTTEGTESDVTLNGSETFSDQFSYTTAAGDTPALNVAVSSQDDSAGATVTVNEPSGFDVTIADVDSAVTAGETVTVAYEVTNTGDVQDTQSIEFAVNGTTEGTESGVTLNGSEIFSGQFTYDTVADDVPTVSVTVSSQDDSASETVTVNEPANFDVTVTSVDASVTAGETVTVAYEVTNTGDVQDTQSIEFAVNGTTEDTEVGVTLNGSETFSGQFSYTTAADDTPAVSVTVSSQDDSVTETVTMNEPAGFDVTISSVDSPVTAGETITVAYEVVNTGDVQGTQDIEFDVNGTTESIESGVTLNGSETFSGQFSYQTATGDTPAVSVTVSSQDDSVTETVSVNEPAGFDVTISSVDSSVTAGETVTVAYEVTNTGDVPDTQDIDFAVNGSLEDTEGGVTLNGSEIFSGQFTYATAAGDTPAVSVTVSSNDASATETVPVNEPATFTVGIVETNTPVAGETLNVTVQVQNTGDVGDEQTVDLSAGALGTDTATVTLGGGASTNVTVSVGTDAGDVGEYTATVSSADDQASVNVTVLAPAEFAVDIVETNTPVEGEQLNVTASVVNTGDIQDTQTIDLDVGALGTDSTSVMLGGGSTTNTTLSVATGAGDAGEYTATVSSEDDSASANVTVLAPAEFAVGIVETNTPVEGEQLNVTAEISNTGDVADSQVIELDVGALGSDSRAAAVVGGESLNVTLSVSTGTGDAGEYTATVSSADDVASAGVTVLAPAGFAVDILETTTPVAGEQLNVTAEITNTGDVGDTQTIDLSAGALGSDSTSVTLAGGAATNLTLSVGTDAGDAGEYTATVSSEDDSASANVTVLAPAEFTVDIVETNTPVTGEQLNLTAGLQNTGDIGGTRTVTLDVGALGSSSTSVTLAGGASTTVTLSLDTTDGDAGNYTANVSTADDTDSTSVTVLAPAEFTVGIDTTNSPVVAGETLSVETTVENTGDVEDTQTVTLDVGAPGSNTASVTLAGGETTAVTLSVTTSGGDAGTYTAVVESDDDTETESVTVLAQAEFGITVVETGAPVEGENLTVTAAVENTGDVEATQTVTLDAGALGADSAQVTLGGGESTNRTLSVGTESGDAGEYTVTVASANDTDSATVPVLVPPVSVLSNLTVAGDGNESLVLRGVAENVTANVTNQGEVSGEFEMTLVVSGEETVEVTQTVTVGPGETVPVQFENVTGALGGGVYNVTVATAGGELTGELVVSVDPNGNDQPALDTTGDGLLNDLTGEGEFDIFDVQTLFGSLDSQPLQTSAELFDFAGLSATRVSIFDVQALFAELQVQNG